MLREELQKDVDLRKLIDEEKKARLDSESIKGAHICVEIVIIYFKNILDKIRILQK